MTKRCWPWSHKWGKWEMIVLLRPVADHPGNNTHKVNAQDRRCVRCGKYQRKIL